MVVLYHPCPKRHRLWGEIWWVEEESRWVFFDDLQASDTYAEHVEYCPSCGEPLERRELSMIRPEERGRAVTTDDRDSGLEVPQTLYQPGDPVWVGRSRGSEREGTILRNLGEGYYSVSMVGSEGTRNVHEGLLHPRREDEEG